MKKKTKNLKKVIKDWERGIPKRAMSYCKKNPVILPSEIKFCFRDL